MKTLHNDCNPLHRVFTLQVATKVTVVVLPRLVCQLLQEGCGLPLLAALLSPEEAGELALQAAYLAYLWGSAALMGLEPQASTF